MLAHNPGDAAARRADLDFMQLQAETLKVDA
jgi:hypothetical protein